MRTDKNWRLLGQGLAVLTLSAALAVCGGSSDASASDNSAAAASGASVAAASPYYPVTITISADPTGGQDATAAIQNAIDSCPTNGSGCQVILPAGIYKVTSTITISKDNVTLRGAGKAITQISFQPNIASAALVFSKPNPATSDIARVELHDLGIYSPNTSLEKTALKLMAVTMSNIENIYITGAGPNSSFTGGSGSIGIETHGHDTTTVTNAYVNADKPIDIGVNPDGYGGTQLDMDQWHWSNLYLIANNHPDIMVENGTVLTSVTWDGFEAWVGGTFGFYFVTDTRPSSYMLTFDHVRTEQGTCSSCDSFHIVSPNSQIQGVRIQNFAADPNRHGIYLRNTFWTGIDQFSYGGTGVVFDADNSNYNYKVTNSHFGSGTLGSGTTITIGPNSYVNMP
jgi:polygalacturonase